MRSRLLLLAPALILASALFAPAAPNSCGCETLTLDRLQTMKTCELMELFRAAQVGKPIDGVAKGRLVNLTDRVAPRLKIQLANAAWRGKRAQAFDGYFINRWIGGVEWIESHYVIGPSWVDGKPAVIMEYPRKTPLFWNMHDELREVAPGLYLGPVYHRFPCPRFRGFVALELECGCK